MHHDVYNNIIIIITTSYGTVQHPRVTTRQDYLKTCVLDAKYITDTTLVLVSQEESNRPRKYNLKIRYISSHPRDFDNVSAQDATMLLYLDNSLTEPFVLDNSSNDTFYSTSVHVA